MNRLKRQHDIERDCVFVELNQKRDGGACGHVLSVLVTNKITKSMLGKNNAKQAVNFQVLSFCHRRSHLKFEPRVVQELADVGWPVAREFVETPGHAVERLEARLSALGWAV